MENTIQNNSNTPKVQLKAPDFFLLLGILVALITTFISAVSVVFKGLDRVMGDASTGYFGITNGVQNALAFFIVGIIVLYVLEYINKRRINNNKTHLLVPLRKWMLLSVLFILGLVILGDFITLIRYFLSGEITRVFISKVLTLFGFSSLVFIYYFHVLTWDNIWSKHSRTAFSYLGMVVSGLIIVFGFYLIGTPATQRFIRIDQERENTVQTINSEVINYWQTTGQMPKTQNDLLKMPSGFFIGDYRTDLSLYTYNLTDANKKTYEICTTFNFSTEKINSYMDNIGNYYTKPVMSSVYMGDGEFSVPIDINQNWDHTEGAYCFKKVIDPKFYPVYKR